jgi:adenine phosphoribosyltransferase
MSELTTTKLAGLVTERIRVVPDFPRPGIAFQDLCGVFADPRLLSAIAAAMADAFAGDFDRVLAVEARGFVLGTAVALHSGVPLVLARKKGKLPGRLRSVAYQLEYGQAELEIQHAAVAPGEQVLVVDDVLATGGTLAAASALVEQAGASTAGHAVLLEIAALNGAQRLRPAPVFTLLSV